MIKSISFRNTPIRFVDKGKGRAIVLLHGFPESLEIWDAYINQLSKRFRVIAIDLPGHGKSGCVGYAHSMELMADCVKKVMDSLRLRRYIIVGHSMGGYVGLAFAELYPDNLKGLCLFHSSAFADSEAKKKDRDRTIEVVKKHQRQFAKAFVTNLFANENKKHFKEEIKKLQDIATQNPKQGIVAALLGMKERKNREVVLKFAPYPVLFIIGKEDKVIDWQQMLEQAELPEKKDILLLDHVAHMGFYEARDETLNKITLFAGKCFRGRFS